MPEEFEEGFDLREIAAVESVEKDQLEFERKYRPVPGAPFNSPERFALLRTLFQDTQDHVAFQLHSARDLYKGVETDISVNLGAHVMQRTLVNPYKPELTVDTCALTTIRNVLRATSGFDQEKDSEEAMLRELDSSVIKDDGLIEHSTAASALLGRRGYDTQSTNNLIKVLQTLRMGGLVSLLTNKHVVLVCGFTSNSSGNIVFRIRDPASQEVLAMTDEEMVTYTSDWRWEAAVLIEKKKKDQSLL